MDLPPNPASPSTEKNKTIEASISVQSVSLKTAMEGGSSGGDEARNLTDGVVSESDTPSSSLIKEICGVTPQ